LSFNQPKLSSTINWNPIAITFANQSIVGTQPLDIFINRNNTIYVPHRQEPHILVWHEDNNNEVTIIPGNFTKPGSLFVTSNGDIYIDDGLENSRVQKWISSNKTWITVMNVNSTCSDLFVDINENLYCSLFYRHQVVQKPLNDFVITSNIVAGTGVAGSASNILNKPMGIFVDMNLDLYVTDCGNDRVQLFQSRQSNGITVAGSKSLNPTVSLNCPSGIVLDAEKYLFIVDMKKNRIIRSDTNGFRCLVGCHGSGAKSNQLIDPVVLSFDVSGNMYVTDQSNHRIQKFERMELTSANSFNQPQFCSTANWNPNAITFANQSIVGTQPLDIFINTNNTIYGANQQKQQILVWHEGSNNKVTIISGNFSDARSLFVTSNGDIYIADGLRYGRVQKWISSNKTWIILVDVNSACWGLFVDINENLYCSLPSRHQVIKKSLNDFVMVWDIVTGTGASGSASNELNAPRGIFVDTNLDLYVTECGNHRVQLFQSRQSNGITIAGSKSPSPTIALDCPSGVILDAEKYLFIVENRNHRIIRSDANGFRCLVGCRGSGAESNQLNSPVSLSFDVSGNMYVTDQSNHRIQKFEFLENSCALLFHQTKFCVTPVWNRKGITFANQKTLGSNPTTIFINGKNSVYTINKEKKQILVWYENNTDPTLVITNDFYNSSSLFVTSNGDIYIDNGEENDRVEQWKASTKKYSPVLFTYSSCKSLFVDTSDYLYCSMYSHHFVVKRYLYDLVLRSEIVAGTGIFGSTSKQLNGPIGIFIDAKFDLYVADCRNNRVQLFRSGKVDGETVAGRESSNTTISLDCPTGITFDAHKYLFIVDSNNHRIIRSGPNGFRCVVGCYGSGSQSTQLSLPSAISFDRSGNMFVVDAGNSRIQKFEYSGNSCVNPINIQFNSSFELTIDSPKYCRDYVKSNYYYQTFQINVHAADTYTLWSESNIDTYGYIYKNDFDPLQPFGNLLFQHSGYCNQGQLKFIVDLQANMQYILVVTTYFPNATGNFSIFISGQNEISIKKFSSRYHSCGIGDRCHFYSTTIGLPLEDILRGEVKPNTTLSDQSSSIKTSAALSII
ncbi:unnamed protein product, partial [Adineta steineri]